MEDGFLHNHIGLSRIAFTTPDRHIRVKVVLLKMSSHKEYASEKKSLLGSGTLVVFPTDGPPPQVTTPTTSPELLFFTIYPTTMQDLQINELLWHMSHNTYFFQRKLATVLPPSAPKHPAFAVVIPAQLARFLASVTLNEMRAAVIYMLADAAQGEDPKGLAQMQADLPSCVWRSLTCLMEQTAAQRNAGWGVAEGASAGITRASFLLDAALQTAPSQDYWKIQIEIGFAEPMMIGNGNVPLTLATREKRDLGIRCLRVLSKLKADEDASNGDNMGPKRAQVLHSLYEDWCRYSAICSWVPPNSCGERSRTGEREEVSSRYKDAFTLMTCLVGCDGQQYTWERVRSLRLCMSDTRSFVSWLPTQIVDQILIPMVVITDGQDAALALRARSPPVEMDEQTMEMDQQVGSCVGNA